MKARPECIVCALKQALNTAKRVTGDEDVQREILAQVAGRMTTATLDVSPAEISQPAYEVVSSVTNVGDPYAAEKRETNTVALEILPHVAAMVAAAGDPLDAALHAAVAGNIIDLGIEHSFDIAQDITDIMHKPFALNDSEDFRKDLRRGRKLLYLGDNAGEIVFDTLLVRELLKTGVEVTFTVKSGPVINDATREDAVFTGMDKLVPVIETGGADIGVDWHNVSDEFRAAFDAADVIVAKGHGNFETCNDRPENIYFLLKAKCEIVARELGVRLGDIVFRHGGTL